MHGWSTHTVVSCCALVVGCKAYQRLCNIVWFTRQSAGYSISLALPFCYLPSAGDNSTFTVKPHSVLEQANLPARHLPSNFNITLQVPVYTSDEEEAVQLCRTRSMVVVSFTVSQQAQLLGVAAVAVKSDKEILEPMDPILKEAVVKFGKEFVPIPPGIMALSCHATLLPIFTSLSPSNIIWGQNVHRAPYTHQAIQLICGTL